MISTLKKITTKAKQLYKTGKYAKWTDAIKEASKSLNKKPAKKKIGYSKERLNIVKNVGLLYRIHVFFNGFQQSRYICLVVVYHIQIIKI